jgi:hypothetical protein
MGWTCSSDGEDMYTGIGSSRRHGRSGRIIIIIIIISRS